MTPGQCTEPHFVGDARAMLYETRGSFRVVLGIVVTSNNQRNQEGVGVIISNFGTSSSEARDASAGVRTRQETQPLELLCGQ